MLYIAVQTSNFSWIRGSEGIHTTLYNFHLLFHRELRLNPVTLSLLNLSVCKHIQYTETSVAGLHFYNTALFHATFRLTALKHCRCSAQGKVWRRLKRVSVESLLLKKTNVRSNFCSFLLENIWVTECLIILRNDAPNLVEQAQSFSLNAVHSYLMRHWPLLNRAQPYGSEA